MRRFRSLLLVVLGSVLCASLGYAAALTMAPSRGSEGDAPPIGPVTAEVELRRIAATLVVRGDATFSDPVELVVRTAAPLPVVTRAPKRRGDDLGPGEVVLEVAGRPVIALAGSLPAYRDLAPGDVGPDVAQLESALAAIGLDPGDVDDEFTTYTSDAVTELYDGLGYEPPTGKTALPMSEVAYVPTLPRRVDRMPARLGQQLPERPVLLSGSDLVISIGLTDADREVVEPGMDVVLDVPGEKAVHGRLGAVDETATGARTSVRLTGLDGRQQAALEGANVKVTVPLQRTRGKVLVVPLAALTTDAAGRVRVVRVEPDGSSETVAVEIGLAAEGYVEVRPADDELAAGDHVVVGE